MINSRSLYYSHMPVFLAAIRYITADHRAATSLFHLSDITFHSLIGSSRTDRLDHSPHHKAAGHHITITYRKLPYGAVTSVFHFPIRLSDSTLQSLLGISRDDTLPDSSHHRAVTYRYHISSQSTLRRMSHFHFSSQVLPKTVTDNDVHVRFSTIFPQNTFRVHARKGRPGSADSGGKHPQGGAGGPIDLVKLLSLWWFGTISTGILRTWIARTIRGYRTRFARSGFVQFFREKQKYACRLHGYSGVMITC